MLARCLSRMLQCAEAGELDIVVVANGCRDATVEIARSFGAGVRVIDLEEASKHKALRAGDATAASFPRLYVDADVVLPLESIRAVASLLRSGRAQVAAPRMRVNLDAASWAVRAYYRIWLQLPYHANGTIGSGVYALSKSGRERFEAFPDIISDDGFVRLNFAPEERVSLADVFFEITAPRTLGGVLSVKTRSQKGWRQLGEQFPELMGNDQSNYRSSIGVLLSAPSNWPATVVYGLVAAVTKFRSWRLNRTGRLSDWERDDSSRNGTPPQTEMTSRGPRAFTTEGTDERNPR